MVTQIKLRGRLFLLGTWLWIGMAAAKGAEPDLVPLPVKFPGPAFQDPPTFQEYGPEIEKPGPPTGWDLPLVPKGILNVALQKPVTVSTNGINRTKPEQVTDGDKDSNLDNLFEMPKGLQWVQVDLRERYEIHAIVIWHGGIAFFPVFNQVIVQIADDADFTKNVRTLFNNDHKNEAGLGAGTDRLYRETQFGRVIKANRQIARYVRWYSRGSNRSALNFRRELEVYALPAARANPATQ